MSIGAITDDLADMFADVLTYEPPGTYDGWGDMTPGTPVQIPCHIEGQHRITRDQLGQEVVSTVQAYLRGSYGVVVDGKFTLPARFSPQEPPAINVVEETDESGAHHEVVMF